jgi:dipeptidase E
MSNGSEGLKIFLICRNKCDVWAIVKKRAPDLNLVLYSGGQSKSNHRLHAEVVRLALAGRMRASSSKTLKSGPLRLAYIPYMADGASPFFERAMRRYRAVGIEQFYVLEPDHRPTRAELATLLSSDVIYLAGGNTYTFLHHLRRSGLLEPLQTFARRGGVLAGLSAGAILMTPTIGLAGVPRYDADDNEIGLSGKRELAALGLVEFEFSPHDTADPRRKRELLAYSSQIKRPVFSVADGGGLVVEGDRLGLYGQVRVFSRGECWRL